MKIHNQLPLLLECLSRWRECPTEKQFIKEFAEPMQTAAGGFFKDFYSVLPDLDWKDYRDHTLKLDADDMEKRIRKHLTDVEALFGFKLKGEIILMGAFNEMDGYARFTQGTHRVFLGVDENHHRGNYLDILMVHELTHVARESRPEVWTGFGLNPKMSNAEFTQVQPVVEHLVGEGFSCVVSELLVPGHDSWEYVYQTEKSLEEVFDKARILDNVIHEELADKEGHYGNLYGTRPLFAHYVWAMHWVKTLLKKYADGDPKKFVALCSKDFVNDALAFNLKR